MGNSWAIREVPKCSVADFISLLTGVTIVAVLVECLVAQCIKVITTLGGFKRDGFCRGHLWNEMLMPGTCDSFPKDEGWAG